MKESSKAAELYSYSVTPNFYPGKALESQLMAPTNKRKSTRYTWLTFFPIAFALQFRKVVYIFYIITGVFNFYKPIQVNMPIVVIGPTIIIMCIGIVNEFIAELKRSRDDKKVNATPVKRLALPDSPLYSANGKDKLQFEDACLAEVLVGDIIKISDGQQVPADCILLKVADDKPEAYVKTSALDGERNLKPKLANPLIGGVFDTMFGPNAQQSKPDLTISCIEPIKELYYFEGRLRATLPDEPEFKCALDLN